MDVGRVPEQLEMDYTCHDADLREIVEHILGHNYPHYQGSSFACMKEINVHTSS